MVKMLITHVLDVLLFALAESTLGSPILLFSLQKTGLVLLERRQVAQASHTERRWATHLRVSGGLAPGVRGTLSSSVLGWSPDR